MELFNHWTWAIYGVIVFNWLAYMFTKDGYDDTRKKFRPKAYALRRWDNWVWSFLFIPIVVVYAKEIFYYFMQAYEKDWTFYDVVYLGAGALSEFVYYLFKKLRSITQALKFTK